jgi:histidine triad (HIT) family protein
MRTLGMFAVGVVLGALLGAYFFVDVRPRVFVSPSHCSVHCFDAKELGGLLVSIGVQKTPDLLPNVVEETDKTIALKSPEPLAKVDYLILPKKDIFDLGDLSAEDAGYVADAFEVMADLVRQDQLTDYKVITNGPGFQQVRYLHFHLLAQ